MSGSLSFSFLVSLSLLAKSKAVPGAAPGVFGVLACPNDANAPVPSPNADAPALGDFTDVGVPELNGLVLLCADRGPNAREESGLPLFRSRSFVGNGGSLSLLLQHGQQSLSNATSDLLRSSSPNCGLVHDLHLKQARGLGHWYYRIRGIVVDRMRFPPILIMRSAVSA